MRRPKRDMTRPQAPIFGYENGWKSRWKDAYQAAWDRTNGRYGMAIALGLAPELPWRGLYVSNELEVE